MLLCTASTNPSSSFTQFSFMYIVFKHCLPEFRFKIKPNQTKYQQIDMTMFMFFRMISGFGVMDQSSSTLTGVLVSRIIQEELNIAW